MHMSESSENSSTDMLLTRLGLGAEFPVGLRVMAIDPDFASLRLLNGLLIQCNFTVLHEKSARSALERVYVQNEECDIVVTELDNLDVDAFGFLERMRKRVPIVVLSNLDDKRMIMKAILTGVSDYMLKPATFEMMRNIWQHVLRSRLSSNNSGIQLQTNHGDIPWRNPSSNLNNPPNSSPNPNSSPTKLQLLEGGTSEKQKIDDSNIDEICPHMMTENTNSENKVNCELVNDNGGNCMDNNGDSNSIKKTRISWHDDLHQRFITAVDQLCGPDVAKPKQILELMNVPGLSRENVASHLQKYRLALKNQLKVQPIWMDSNNNEAATTSYNNGVENCSQMGVPFLHSAEATGQLYSQYHDYYSSSSSPPPIIEPQYDAAMFNIPNHLFNHSSQAFHGLAPQQPPTAPGGNFINTMRVINGVNFPAAAPR